MNDTWLEPHYEEVVRFKPIPYEPITDRIGVARSEFCDIIVIDGWSVGRISHARRETVMRTPIKELLPFVRKMVKDWNMTAERQREFLIDKSEAQKPIEDIP